LGNTSSPLCRTFKGELNRPVVEGASMAFTIDDFEMRDYSPMKPQLKFELGI
jgi:thymidylate synthase